MSDDQLDDSPLDLLPLAPDLVSPVMRCIEQLPDAHAHHIGPLWGVWSMGRGLAVAGVMAVCVLLALTQPWQTRQAQRPHTVAESLGVPPEFLDMLSRQGDRQ